MRRDPTFLVWHVQCATPVIAERIRNTVRETGALDFVEEVTRAGGGANEVLRYRLGDYFAQITLLSESKDYADCLRLLFERLPAAGAYWKDLMVHLLGRVQKAGGEVSINLAYKGDEFPSKA
jgi:hypothetical protein